MTEWPTRVLHPEREPDRDFRSLVTPVYRGSTTVFHRAEDAVDDWHQEAGYTYGLYGTPTTRDLARRICALEHGWRTFLTPGGQSAVALISLALTNAGDHVLLPDSAYGPTRLFAEDVLRRFGVDVDYYPPLAGDRIEDLFRPATRLVWTESPGSVTMEVQDVPALAAVAHRHGALVAMDNTYSAGIFFDAFRHGVDVTMQALTKYVGGHSDLLLGSVTVRDAEMNERIGLTHGRLGMAVSPDDCSLALRGLATLGVRLAALERNTLRVARWLAEQTSVATVLHPALPSCPGHEIWRRDFTGSTSVFSFVFAEGVPQRRIFDVVDGLRLFQIGYSWGGTHSLAVAWPELTRTYGTPYGDRLVRLNIGLEDPQDLIDDLDQALERAPSSR
jgi:cysteine-S-conjugate beta-lyase